MRPLTFAKRCRRIIRPRSRYGPASRPRLLRLIVWAPLGRRISWSTTWQPVGGHARPADRVAVRQGGAEGSKRPGRDCRNASMTASRQDAHTATSAELSEASRSLRGSRHFGSTMRRRRCSNSAKFGRAVRAHIAAGIRTANTHPVRLGGWPPAAVRPSAGPRRSDRATRSHSMSHPLERGCQSLSAAVKCQPVWFFHGAARSPPLPP